MRIRPAMWMSIGLSAVLALSSAVLGQTRPTADEVTADVQAFYEQTTAFQAEFRQTQYTKLYDRTQNARGRVTFKKPGKMRFEYADPAGKVLVSDGAHVVFYEPGEDGEAGQYIERTMDDTDIAAPLSFLLGTGRIADQFRARLLDASQWHFAQGQVLELRPKRPSPHYDRVVFYVQSSTNAAGQRRPFVRAVLIVDHAGNRNKFEFVPRSVQLSPPSNPPADSVFSFTPPAGAQQIRP